jgi:hypothetical protein
MNVFFQKIRTPIDSKCNKESPEAPFTKWDDAIFSFCERGLFLFPLYTKGDRGRFVKIKYDAEPSPPIHKRNEELIYYGFSAEQAYFLT